MRKLGLALVAVITLAGCENKQSGEVLLGGVIAAGIVCGLADAC